MAQPEILICDDELGIRESLKLILEQGHSLTFATNGEAVIAHLQQHSPALLILDVKMPRMGGLDTLRAVKHQKPSLPVLVISGYESADIAAQAITLGAADYLTKPFDRHVVLAKVRALLPAAPST